MKCAHGAGRFPIIQDFQLLWNRAWVECSWLSLLSRMVGNYNNNMYLNDGLGKFLVISQIIKLWNGPPPDVGFFYIWELTLISSTSSRVGYFSIIRRRYYNKLSYIRYWSDWKALDAVVDGMQLFLLINMFQYSVLLIYICSVFSIRHKRKSSPYNIAVSFWGGTIETIEGVCRVSRYKDTKLILLACLWRSLRETGELLNFPTALNYTNLFLALTSSRPITSLSNVERGEYLDGDHRGFRPREVDFWTNQDWVRCE